MGPATTLDGKDVPEGGMSVNYSDVQVRQMMEHGHQFSDASGDVAIEQPTPQEANDGGAEAKPKKA